MRRTFFVLVAVLTLCVSASAAETTNVSAADQVAIKQTALDFIEGWYEGDAERMERAMHPELAKRIVHTYPEGPAVWIKWVRRNDQYRWSLRRAWA